MKYVGIISNGLSDRDIWQQKVRLAPHPIRHVISELQFKLRCSGASVTVLSLEPASHDLCS